jgi:hypothetical protein
LEINDIAVHAKRLCPYFFGGGGVEIGLKTIINVIQFWRNLFFVFDETNPNFSP